MNGIRDIRTLIIVSTLFACLGGGFDACASAAEPSTFRLLPAAEVDGSGVHLHQIATGESALPIIRLCDAPAPGKALVFTRKDLERFALTADESIVLTNWTGVDTVRITRRMKNFVESDALELLTPTLQDEHVRDRGELELRFNRPWTSVPLPDEPITVNILDLPTSGVSPHFILRFELQTAHENLGTYQASLQARIWREVWVAGSTLRRGIALADADVRLERRDMLTLRGPLADIVPGDPMLELAESLSAGSPLLERSVRLRPVIHRGQMTEALLTDGALSITMKVEALESGVPGQVIRARNPQTRRDVRGQVLDAGTILITL